jgi:hypothetical protein
MPKMIPFWCGQGKLGLADPFFWQQALRIVPLINISASDMFDLARADDSLSRLMTTFRKGSNIWDCSKLASVTEYGKNSAGNIPYMRKISVSRFWISSIFLGRERLYPCYH